jgi:hypothetical protein
LVPYPRHFDHFGTADGCRGISDARANIVEAGEETRDENLPHCIW